VNRAERRSGRFSESANSQSCDGAARLGYYRPLQQREGSLNSQPTIKEAEQQRRSKACLRPALPQSRDVEGTRCVTPILATRHRSTGRRVVPPYPSTNRHPPDRSVNRDFCENQRAEVALSCRRTHKSQNVEWHCHHADPNYKNPGVFCFLGNGFFTSDHRHRQRASHTLMNPTTRPLPTVAPTNVRGKRQGGRSLSTSPARPTSQTRRLEGRIQTTASQSQHSDLHFELDHGPWLRDGGGARAQRRAPHGALQCTRMPDGESISRTASNLLDPNQLNLRLVHEGRRVRQSADMVTV
jgi:hypothetical protein